MNVTGKLTSLSRVRKWKKVFQEGKLHEKMITKVLDSKKEMNFTFQFHIPHPFDLNLKLKI